jgi:hypothetical protein
MRHFVSLAAVLFFLPACGFFQTKKGEEAREAQGASMAKTGEGSNQTGLASESLQLTSSIESLTLTARKDYRPSRWTDGKHEFDNDTEFKIPGVLNVTFGNSGNHKSYLYFKKQADSKESRCEYKGGSSQSQPKGAELNKAKVYKLVSCAGGLKAGDFGVAKALRLNLDNGGNYNNTSGNTHTIITAAIEFKVSGPVLPPDPGEAGKATLLGIDSDNDGVRDDVQRLIALRYPDSLPKRRAATQFANGLINSLSNEPPTTQQVHAWANQELKNGECFLFIFKDFDSSWDERRLLRQAILNTHQRNIAHISWSKKMGGYYGSLVPRGQEASTCQFNTNER